MTDREKLIDLLCKAHSKAIDEILSDDISYAQQLEIEADHLLDNGVTFQKWIPVSERLPEEDGKFLVHRIIFGGVSTMSVVGFARNGKKVHEYDLRKKKNVWYEYDSEVGYYSLDTVTHWMPLPNPPEGG